MIKILHTADWHLDAPMSGHTPEIARVLQAESRKIPEKIVTLCKENNIPIIAFALQEPGSIEKAAAGETIGTLID